MNRPFIGVDGEGGGQDELGRQNYLLFRAGDQLLFKENERLTSIELLEMIASLDPDAGEYVAYYFNYDVTMILRDISRHVPPGLKVSTFWEGYLLTYLPGRFFSVARGEWKAGQHVPRRLTKPVVINDVGPFFQVRFYKALTDWKIGTDEQLAAIAKGKYERDHFEVITPDIIEYNKLECKMLAEMMTKFRETCAETGYLPDRWQGPGWLAAKMMKKNAVARRQDYQERHDPYLWNFANAAYYGGRFEVTRIGAVNETVHEYDINSAYPSAMRNLPCMLHGTWTKTTLFDIDRYRGETFCADLSFVYPQGTRLCDFPIRDKTGTIYFPREGRGWYWNPEITAAHRRGSCQLTVHSAWIYKRECFCTPFDYISSVYEYRKSIGKSTQGYPIKLALNSHYGKLCQSVGEAPYANPIWGGLITSACRAMLIDAYAKTCEENILMLATDGIYSLEPIDLDIGGNLGQWENKVHEAGMFFVQPGLYFYNKSRLYPKTRGVPLVKVLEYEQQFRTRWASWVENTSKNLFGELLDIPSVPIELKTFIGYRLAQARHRPSSAGRWDTVTRHVSFDWKSKRDHGIIRDEAVITQPRDGRLTLRTIPYSKVIGKAFDNLLTADQPDYFVFGDEAEKLT